SPLDFINDVFNPYEKVDKFISEFREELRQLAYAIEEKLNSTSTLGLHPTFVSQTGLNLNSKSLDRRRVSRYVSRVQKESEEEEKEKELHKNTSTVDLESQYIE